MLLCSGFPARSLFVYWDACFCMKMVSELHSSSLLLCLKQHQKHNFFFFFKRKNLWITKRFLLWIFWSLTNKPARIHFGDQENSFWDLLHSLRCWLLRKKPVWAKESFASKIHLHTVNFLFIYWHFRIYEFVGVDGNVLLVCLSVPASMVCNSVSDHKNPLIDIFENYTWPLHFISIVDNIVNLT